MSWAANIVPACQELADALTAAGLPATLSRSSLRVPGAWVTPETAEGRTLAGAGRAHVSVLLVTQPAGDAEVLRDLQGQLLTLLEVILPAGPVDTSVVMPHNNNALPAFRVPVALKLEA